ncbi:heterokaryon incompatibility protein-domain-containing protein [Apodospora peruviana]|uniref:Heterokaryon incompatibility protein-domain-containing protein n=1 Tax=Apodospora peruviana TaxID=516989 RepID=A0AAE0I6A4_9PEZI|nr:heterokaryon incompatibility protein-domain-containing protein [Apodospora peruviana]
MSRWHEASCSQPVIQVEDGDVACCTSCGSRYRWQENIPRNESSNSVLGIPEAGPSDRMNLRWPGSVPYKSILGNPSPDPSQSTEIPTDSNKADASQPHGSRIYGDTLAPDEFRLACLTAVEGDNEQFPLHVSLEVFKDHNCPEYETVSYTWGGEEGDYSLSRPIFIGPFWDVLFQTKNCWEMLRFIRPWRGTRMVWVDALCINQANLPERGQQVAKMARIYENCMRAIVYLGSDIVLPLSRGDFPTRSRLLELASGSVAPKLPAHCKLAGRLSLAEVLARQYFSRVWVIQELLLSRQTVIRIGDVDFWTDSTPWGTSGEQKANLESMQAPWVRFLAQKTFTATSIVGVLQTTAASKASDPRDKIFGLLSLVYLNDTERRQWQPDYSIPPAHIFTGFFAHCIVNLQKLVFLFSSVGTDSAPSSSPSWVPDWSTAESWQQLMNKTLPEAPAVVSLEGYTSLPTELWGQQNKHFWDWTYNGGAYRRWNDEIAVCTDTGALSLNLTHICKIPTQPIPDTSRKRYGITGRHQNIYLVSDHALDRIVQPGHDHIFVLAYKNKPKPSKIANPIHRLFREKDPPLGSSFYLVLRETERTGAFRLVATCTHLLISSGFDGGGPFGQLGSVHSHLINARRKMEKGFGDRMDISVFFPGAKKGHDLLPMIKALTPHIPGNSDDADLAFRSAYLAWLDEKFHPCVVDGYVEMTLPISDSKRYNGNRVSITLYEMDATDRSNSPKLAGGENYIHTTQVSWDYKRYNKWAPILEREPETLPLLARREFRLRICIKDVAAAVRAWLWDVSAVQRVLRLEYDELVNLLQALPKEEFHCIGCPSVDTQNAMEDFGLKVYTDRVHIV